MNYSDALGLEERNSLPEVLPDEIPETTPIPDPVLPEENTDLGEVLSSPPISEEEVVSDLNFGNQLTNPASISGSKWHDLDGDGEQDDGEPGLEGWTIYLDNNQNGELDDGELSTVTDEDGNYSFTDLPDGTYTVSEELQHTWVQTYPDVSNFLNEPNDTIPDAVASGISNEGIVNTTGFIGDNANISPESDVDFIKVDLEAGDQIILDIDAETFGSPLDSILRVFDSTGTEVAVNDDDDGLDSYIDFTASYADTYYVGVSGYDNFDYDPFIEGSGYGDNTGDYNLTITVGNGTTVPLLGSHVFFLEGGETRTDIDFGNWQPITLSGTKWHDVDGDGTQDADEAALPGWTIYLDTNNNGELDTGETSTFTDAEGNYSFTLPEGTYTVAEVQQTGWVQTAPTDGSYTVSLDAGETADNLDFGNQAQPGEIHGSKWNDLDADGEWDVAEPGLEGWTIYLDTNKNGQLDDGELSTITDADGNYSFTNLPYGSYTVVEEQQPGWEQTSPNGFANQVTQLTNNEVGDYSPDVSGNQVVWSGYDGVDDDEIYFDDGSQVVQLTNNSTYEYSPQISDGNVVWQGYDGVDDEELYFYDGNQVVQITDNQSYEYGVQISGNNVVWIQEYYDDDNYYSDIYLYDGSQVVQLTNDDDYEDNPQISGNKVVWSAYDGNDEEIYLYDGSQVVQLTNNDVDEYSPDIDGNNVVWQGDDENYNSDIYLYDGSQVVQLTNDDYYKNNPQISGNNVVWSAYDGVDDDELYLYDGSQVVQITDNQTYEYGVQISGDNVVWIQEYYDDDDTYYSDIYLYDGSQVVQLTNDDYYEYNPQISDGNVVWSSFDGTDDEIYTYGQGNTYPVAVQPGEILSNINFGNHLQSNSGTPGDDVLVGTPQSDEIEGFGGNDRISGLADKDTLKGGSGNDIVFGGDGDDVIVGQQNNDRLYGESGNDGVRGNTGDDLVVGGEGNDRVYGGKGMDTLIGVEPTSSQPGLGEIDELNGVQGADRFVLGDASKVYYNDGDDTTSGLSDYASIEDFVLDQNIIQLSGNSSHYFLAESPSGLPAGTAIFLETGSTDELIGIVRNVPLAQLDLTDSSFSYV